MSRELKRLYPEMPHPTRCENGCGSVVELADMFRSYMRDSNGSPKLICKCCAAEIGHLDEDDEEPEESPTCERRPKTRGLP